jgi:hypothetical protein
MASKDDEKEEWKLKDPVGKEYEEELENQKEKDGEELRVYERLRFENEVQHTWIRKHR